MKLLHLLRAVRAFLILILLISASATYAAMVTYSGTDYEVTSIGPQAYESIPGLLQSQPWWGDGTAASDFSTLVAGQLGFPNDSAGDGPYFAYAAAAHIGPTLVEAYTFANASNNAELREFLHGDTEFTWAIASPVPLPAAFWLFCSGLLGLIGLAQKRVS